MLTLIVVAALLSADTATYRIIPGMSRASYAVEEVFLRENNRLFTAVGITPAVSGEIFFDRARPAASRITAIVVDLRELRSDSDRRDRALREKYLATRQFPHARVLSASFEQTPPSAREGVPFQFALTADLQVHGVTRRTTWRGDATVVGDTLRGTARTNVKMSSFGIEVPNLFTLRSSDDVALEINFVAARN
jgi:polyisoprenoid-binding protein YceI